MNQLHSAPKPFKSFLRKLQGRPVLIQPDDLDSWKGFKHSFRVAAKANGCIDDPAVLDRAEERIVSSSKTGRCGVSCRYSGNSSKTRICGQYALVFDLSLSKTTSSCIYYRIVGERPGSSIPRPLKILWARCAKHPATHALNILNKSSLSVKLARCQSHSANANRHNTLAVQIRVKTKSSKSGLNHLFKHFL